MAAGRYMVSQGKEILVVTTEYAGGFSYPFKVMNFLREMDRRINFDRSEENRIRVIQLLMEMGGDENFPEESRGKYLFLRGYVRPQEEYSFAVEMDLDAWTVTLHLEHLLGTIENTVIAIPMDGTEGEFCGTEMEKAVKDCQQEGRAAHEIAEEVYRSKIEEAFFEIEQMKNCQLM